MRLSNCAGVLCTLLGWTLASRDMRYARAPCVHCRQQQPQPKHVQSKETGKNSKQQKAEANLQEKEQKQTKQGDKQQEKKKKAKQEDKQQEEILQEKEEKETKPGKKNIRRHPNGFEVRLNSVGTVG